MAFTAYEMNICSVKADFVSCCMKIDASSRLSRGCFLDVKGCSSECISQQERGRLTMMTGIPPTRQNDSSASTSFTTIYPLVWMPGRDS